MPLHGNCNRNTFTGSSSAPAAAIALLDIHQPSPSTGRNRFVPGISCTSLSSVVEKTIKAKALDNHWPNLCETKVIGNQEEAKVLSFECVRLSITCNVDLPDFQLLHTGI